MRMTRKLRRVASSTGLNFQPVTDVSNATNADEWKKWDRYDH